MHARTKNNNHLEKLPEALRKSFVFACCRSRIHQHPTFISFHQPLAQAAMGEAWQGYCRAEAISCNHRITKQLCLEPWPLVPVATEKALNCSSKHSCINSAFISPCTTNQGNYSSSSCSSPWAGRSAGFQPLLFQGSFSPLTAQSCCH